MTELKASWPRHRMTRVSLRRSSSLERYGEQFPTSTGAGLLSGGAHLTAAVKYAFLRVKPSDRLSDNDWLANPALWRALIRKSPLRSPVKTRPVLFPPCAAGARPTINNEALGSPNPGIGLPQYSQSKNSLLFFWATSSRYSTRREQRRQSTTSFRTLSSRIAVDRLGPPISWVAGTSKRQDSHE